MKKTTPDPTVLRSELTTLTVRIRQLRAAPETELSQQQLKHLLKKRTFLYHRIERLNNQR